MVSSPGSFASSVHWVIVRHGLFMFDSVPVVLQHGVHWVDFHPPSIFGVTTPTDRVSHYPGGPAMVSSPGSFASSVHWVIVRHGLSVSIICGWPGNVPTFRVNRPCRDLRDKVKHGQSVFAAQGKLHPCIAHI